MSAKPQIMWAVRRPQQGGFIVARCFARMAWDGAERVCGMSTKAMEASGYRCVKVEVREVEK